MKESFSYTDYLLYLGDFCEYKKSINKRYSYYMMALQLGFQVKNFFIELLRSKRSYYLRLILDFQKKMV